MHLTPSNAGQSNNLEISICFAELFVYACYQMSLHWGTARTWSGRHTGV